MHARIAELNRALIAATTKAEQDTIRAAMAAELEAYREQRGLTFGRFYQNPDSHYRLTPKQRAAKQESRKR